MSYNDREYIHAPLAKLDYGLDWSLWLKDGETISTSTWTVEPTLTQSLSQILGGVTSLFVEGGEVNKSYILTNTITTSTPRIDSRTIKLFCKIR